MKIEDLCQQVIRAMIDAGYTQCCAWSRYRDFYSPLISFYHSCGEDEFSLEMMVRYSEYSHARMEEEKICEHRYYQIKDGIKRIIEFHGTGKLYWSSQDKESKLPVNEYYSNLLDQFIGSENFHTNTCGGCTLGFQAVFLLAHAGRIRGFEWCRRDTDSEIAPTVLTGKPA